MIAVVRLALVVVYPTETLTSFRRDTARIIGHGSAGPVRVAVVTAIASWRRFLPTRLAGQCVQVVEQVPQRWDVHKGSADGEGADGFPR